MLTVIASGIPQVPAPVTISIENVAVKIRWTPPPDNFAPITKYLVTVKQSDGTFSVEPVDCDASQPLIFAQAFCVIPESVLLAAPYSLAYNTLIVAKVRAFNINGWTADSAENTSGVNVGIEPVMVATPTEGLLTNQQQVHVKWVALTAYAEIRGAPVTSYNLRWDTGTDGLLWRDLVGATSDSLELEYIITQGIIPGAYYKVQVRAQNKWGWGAWSSIATIRASTWPAVVS